VDTPPFLHRGHTIEGMSRDVAIALLPAAAMAVWTFGIPALRVMALAAGVCVLAEALWDKALGRDLRLYDGTSLTTGLLFSFLLPAGAPWWLVLVGGVLTIILGRQVFGGLGCNPLCPALVGWAAMTISWPAFMDPAAMNLDSPFLDPLMRIKQFGWAALPPDSELSFFLGGQLGGLGSAQIAAVLLGGLFLVARKAARWEIPLAFLAGAFLLGALFWRFGGAMGLNPEATPPPHLYLLTGSTVFAAFFLATDHASSPVGTAGMLLYGLLGGCMVVIIRVFGIYPDGAPFAVLTSSLVTPLLDLIRSAPFGKRRQDHA
jgi:electron transport complex protein RnfD